MYIAAKRMSTSLATLRILMCEDTIFKFICTAKLPKVKLDICKSLYRIEVGEEVTLFCLYLSK